jgi:hypothetical protein
VRMCKVHVGATQSYGALFAKGGLLRKSGLESPSIVRGSFDTTNRMQQASAIKLSLDYLHRRVSPNQTENHGESRP